MDHNSQTENKRVFSIYKSKKEQEEPTPTETRQKFKTKRLKLGKGSFKNTNQGNINENSNGNQNFLFKRTKFNTGRWEPEEHDSFVDNLLIYGNNWRKVLFKLILASRSHQKQKFSTDKVTCSEIRDQTL